MKQILMIGTALAFLLTGGLAFAAGPGDGGQGGAGMQQGQQEGMQQSMKHKKAKKAHSRRRSMEEIKAIQESLNAHGAALTVDGHWGRETRDAIKAYQRKNGLKPTGYANQETRKKLGLKF